MSYQLSKSDVKNKKMTIITPTGKKINFGDDRYEDFTIHKDNERKSAYIKRHGLEDHSNPNKAGFWARWLLWNKESVSESIKDIEKRFKLDIILVA